MADLSFSFSPSEASDASDAASAASAVASDANSAASDALSKIAGLSNTVSALGVSVASDITSAASNAISDAHSDAASQVAVSSDALSKLIVSCLSDAKSYASDVASDAQSKAISDAASDATSKIGQIIKEAIVQVYHPDSAISTGNGKAFLPCTEEMSGMNLVTIGGYLATAATSGTVQVQIYNMGSNVDVLSAGDLLEWDATEKDTGTATSAAVINTSNDGIVLGEAWRVDIDAAGSGAKGMSIRVGAQKP